MLNAESVFKLNHFSSIELYTMKQLLLLTSTIFIIHGADVDRLFEMNAISTPEADRHTINILVWQDKSQPQYKLPAIQLALERVKNESILPDEAMIKYCFTSVK